MCVEPDLINALFNATLDADNSFKWTIKDYTDNPTGQRLLRKLHINQSDSISTKRAKEIKSTIL